MDGFDSFEMEGLTEVNACFFLTKGERLEVDEVEEAAAAALIFLFF